MSDPQWPPSGAGSPARRSQSPPAGLLEVHEGRATSQVMWGAASPHTPAAVSGLAGGPGGMALTPAVHLTPAHVHSAVRNHREVWGDHSVAVGATPAGDLGQRSPGLLTRGRRASGPGVHIPWSVRGPALTLQSLRAPRRAAGHVPKVPPALGSPASAAVPRARLPSRSRGEGAHAGKETTPPFLVLSFTNAPWGTAVG